ncbi:MAG: DUF3108 domain-containing protein [Bacteroidota bacterium]
MRTIITSLFLLLTGAAFGQSLWTSVPNFTFQKGEFLKYRVHYGLLNAGFATMEVSPKSQHINGHRCMHIKGTGVTAGAFDLFYHCEDVYETYVDEKTLLPIQFNRDIQEGDFESYTTIQFDHEQQKAIYTDRKKRVRQYDVPVGIQDVVSAFYFARTTTDHTRLKLGDKISLRNFIDRKTFGLEAVLVKRETIRVEGKKYKALKMKLLVEEAGLITDGSKIEFWISDDHNKIPLRIKSDLAIGSLKADLVEWRNLRHDFTALVSR